MEALLECNFKDLKLFRRGKVRDVYECGDTLLFVATDRISAFDVIMNEGVPDKGKILTQISKFWFENTTHIVDNHFITTEVKNYLPDLISTIVNDGRAMLVKKTQPIMLECVVRGYIAGSGWKEYQRTGSICGNALPAGLKEYGKLPEPIFTPSTKAESGHDENIDFTTACGIVGNETAERLRELSFAIYNFGYDLLYKRGIILADTKFEFGINERGEIILIDEVMTPDSSRFWLLSDYEQGKTPVQFDKQVLRDYLESIGWDKQPPPPTLPQAIIDKTLEKYQFALSAIIGSE